MEPESMKTRVLEIVAFHASHQLVEAKAEVRLRFCRTAGQMRRSSAPLPHGKKTPKGS